MTIYTWWTTQTVNPSTRQARATVHWFMYGVTQLNTLARLYRALCVRGFTDR